MSTSMICLIIGALCLVICTVYLDIVSEQVEQIKELAEEQGWCDPAKVQELGEVRQPRCRRKAAPAAEYFIMPDGEKVRKR